MFTINRSEVKPTIMEFRTRYYSKVKQKKHWWKFTCLQFIFCLNGFELKLLPKPTSGVEFRMWHCRNLCLCWKCLEMNPPTLLSLVLSVCKCVTSLMNSKHSKMNFLLYSHFNAQTLWGWRNNSTSLAARWLHIFQISQRTSAGGDHGGRYKYSAGTCCIPRLLILLTFPHSWLNCLSFKLI